MASTIENVLSDITDDSVKEAKKQFLDLLQQAKGDSSEFARQNAALLEKAFVNLKNGDMERDDFDLFLEDQRAAGEQFVNTQAIAAQARARDLTLTIIDIAAKNIAPRVIPKLNDPAA
jgi:hypothetical protein